MSQDAFAPMLGSNDPRPPVPPTPSYGRDAELVLIGREIDGASRPAVVAGDLNDVAWSSTTTLFQKISGTLDPRVGRGLYNSFHAKSPLLRFPLDTYSTPRISPWSNCEGSNAADRITTKEAE
jgi:hypothetical protein